MSGWDFTYEDLIEGQRLMAAKNFHANNVPWHGDPIVYIMEFTGDIVKVGQTVNYNARMKAHGYKARDLGVEMGRVYWQRSSSLLEDEHTLKALAVAHGGVRMGKSTEWFTGVDFDALADGMLELIVPAPRPIPEWAVLEEAEAA
jgi:hypothetical protein